MAQGVTDRGAQKRASLQLAQARRLRRAALLFDMEDGRLALGAALQHPDLATMKLVDLLERLPHKPRRRGRPGAVRRPKRFTEQAYRLVLGADVCSPWRQVGALTARQRQVLVDCWAAGQRGETP